MFLKNDSILKKILVPLVAGLVLGNLALILFISRSTKQSMIEGAISQAQATVDQYRLLRKYYTENIIQKVKNSSDIKISANHKGEDKTVPLPATMILDLSNAMKENHAAVELKLYSDYPFPGRKGRVIDDFGRAALDYLKSNPDKTLLKPISPPVKRGYASLLRTKCWKHAWDATTLILILQREIGRLTT
jgi:hypothetical protein